MAKAKEPKPPRLTLADLEFQIDYLGKYCNALSTRLTACEAFIAEHQGMTAPLAPEGS